MNIKSNASEWYIYVKYIDILYPVYMLSHSICPGLPGHLYLFLVTL